MPSPSLDGVFYQLRIKWLIHDQQCFNVIHFKSNGVQDLVDDLITPVLNCITTNLLPILGSDTTLLGADVKSITGSTLQEVDHQLVSGNTGGLDVDSLPSTNTCVVRLKTLHPGRTGRGRMALLGIPENHTNHSRLDATFIAAAIAFLACMASAFINGDPPATPFFDWMVKSRKDNAFYAVSTYSVNPVVGSMRSRRVH
jgi:hypothetical protein